MERAARVLRERLGDEGIAELRLVVSDMGREWKQEVLSISAERFERRLVEEISSLRVEMVKEFAAVRNECATQFGGLRAEMAALRSEVLKWSFVFWIGQLAAMAGMMAFLLRSLERG